MRFFLLAGLMACAGGAASDPPSEGAPPDNAATAPMGGDVEEVEPAPPPRRVSVEVGEGPRVDLTFQGISEVHRGAFRNRRHVTVLSKALASCVADEARVTIRYDGEARIGHILIEVDAQGLGCAPDLEQGVLSLEPMEPLGRAVAAYRDAVAGGFDLRVASFKTGVILHGAASCTLLLKGQHPPDGSRWSPCVQVGEQTVCAPAAPAGGVTSLPLAALPGLDRCLAP